MAGWASFPSDDPLEAITELEHIDGNVFRRKRDDGNLGEEIEFEMGEDGKAKSYMHHSNISVRLK